MSWIKTISYSEAEGKLKQIYDRISGSAEGIDNVLKVHSLRPHTLTGHMYLYKSVLHHQANVLPKWWLETLGVYVSLLNGCSYCVEHHYSGLVRLVGKNEAKAIRVILEDDSTFGPLEGGLQAALIYARELTREPAQMQKSHLADLRRGNLDDGQILEINQVVGYFNYVNRTVTGLGVNLSGDHLGLSPGSTGSLEDWKHA